MMRDREPEGGAAAAVRGAGTFVDCPVGGGSDFGSEAGASHLKVNE